MSASSLQGLAGILATVQPPQLGAEYTTLYSNYVETVRHVADLYVKNRVLLDHCCDSARLDVGAAGDPVVRQAENLGIQSQGRLVDVDTSGRGGSDGSTGGAGVADNCSVAHATGETIGRSPSIAGVVSRVGGDSSDSQKKKKKNRKRKSNGTRGGDSVGDVGGCVRGSDAGVEHRGLDTGESEKRCCGSVGLCGCISRHRLCGGVIGREKSGASRSASVKSVNDSRRLERRSFSPDLVSWRSSDGKSDVSDDEIAARSSYWQRRNVENQLAIKKGLFALQEYADKEKRAERVSEKFSVFDELPSDFGDFRSGRRDIRKSRGEY